MLGESVNNLAKVTRDSAAAGIEPASSSRKLNAVTTMALSRTCLVNATVVGKLPKKARMTDFGVVPVFGCSLKVSVSEVVTNAWLVSNCQMSSIIMIVHILPTSTKLQVLHVLRQRRLVRVEGVEDGDHVSPSGG